MHLRAALRNGLTRDELREVILQTAVYAGVPAANTRVPDRPASVLADGPAMRRDQHKTVSGRRGGGRRHPRRRDRA